jgi:predicted transposase YdaD
MDVQLNDWKNSRVYREVKDEGKLEAKLESARSFLRLGVAPEVIAQALGMTLEEVKKLQA